MDQPDHPGLPDLPAEKGTWDETALSRRTLLEGAVGVIACAGVLHIALPGARFLVGDSLKPGKVEWVEIGAVASLPADEVTRVNYSTQAKDAWRTVTRRGTVYVYSDDGGKSYVALDGTCTHLGCIVQWRADDEHFSCPCHLALFTREGKVIAGPPPKPLQQLPVKIENGVLYAQV